MYPISYAGTILTNHIALCLSSKANWHSHLNKALLHAT